MEIATARPVERFSHTQAFDNSYHFGTGTTLLQFTTGFGSERPSCMFSFDNVNAMSMPNSTSALKSSKLLKENAVSLSNFNCKRRLDFNRLTLTNSAHLQDENGNNNNNLNSINNNNNIDCVDFHRSYCAIENVSPQPNTDQRPQTQQQVAPKRSHQNQIKPLTTAVQRRNERERNRVKLINMTFATLREHLPNGKKGSRSKKMSKVETLKAAIDYIRYLKQVVDEHDVVSAVLESSVLASSNALSSPGALASPCVMGSPSVAASPEVLRSPNMVTSPGVPSQRGASSTTPASSPHHSYCSDSSCEGISVDEDDLLDFSNWF